ncbi:Uncharacterized protein HZ326_5922 [Fusarium oxysporum f. sp. albedinis]|nr:Uncharacterized protein HZ326_5922 [Fusarium oxysporum f. sp. albedinis]
MTRQAKLPYVKASSISPVNYRPLRNALSCKLKTPISHVQINPSPSLELSHDIPQPPCTRGRPFTDALTRGFH